MSFIISWTCSNSCALSQRCHPMISSSVIPYSSCLQSFPALGSFLMNQLFAWGGQSTGVSALASVFPNNTQDWSPLEWTSWISLQSKGLSGVFSNTTVQEHQFFVFWLCTYLPRKVPKWMWSKSLGFLSTSKPRHSCCRTFKEVRLKVRTQHNSFW